MKKIYPSQSTISAKGGKIYGNVSYVNQPLRSLHKTSVSIKYAPKIYTVNYEYTRTFATKIIQSGPPSARIYFKNYSSVPSRMKWSYLQRAFLPHSAGVCERCVNALLYLVRLIPVVCTNNILNDVLTSIFQHADMFPHESHTATTGRSFGWVYSATLI